MTIDEAIAHEIKEANDQRSHIGTYDEKYSQKCKEWAEYHEQLAEWLGELKVLRPGTVIKSGEYPYFNGFKEGKKIGYNKAIDELKSKICMHFADWEFSEDDKLIKDIIELASESVEEIAKQLKAGGDNEIQ